VQPACNRKRAPSGIITGRGYRKAANPKFKRGTKGRDPDPISMARCDAFSPCGLPVSYAR
jgi:hypothetical protein